MTAEWQQSALDELAGRRFSLYPAIRGIEHNDVDAAAGNVVRNLDQERYFGPGDLDSPQPSRRNQQFRFAGPDPGTSARVGIQGGGGGPLSQGRAQHAGNAGRPASAADVQPPEPPRNEFVKGSDAKTFKLLGIALSIGLTVALIGFVAVVVGFQNPFEYFFRPDTTTTDQRYLSLASTDGYHDIVIKMAAPEREQWITREEDELQFQALWYGSRSYIVILMGGARTGMRYIGTIHDPSRRVLDSAALAGGGDTSSLMRNLPDF